MNCSLPVSFGILQARILELGNHSLLQGIFLTQNQTQSSGRFCRQNPHCRQIPYCLRNLGSPKNTGVDSHSLLQGIFPTQGSNSGLQHYRQILFTIWATWVAISYSRGSSWPRDWTPVSCIGGRFLTTAPPGTQKKWPCRSHRAFVWFRKWCSC